MAKRRPFSLMEMMVAIVLTSILLTALMGYLRHTSYLTAEADQQLLPALQRSYAYNQLGRILTQLSNDRAFFPSEQNDHLYFYTSNGVDRNPRLCGEVMGELWLETTGRLALTLWPSPKQWGDVIDGGRTSYLIDGVKKLSFRYYEPPSDKPDKQWGWLTDWKEKGIPAMIEVNLDFGKKGNERMLFVPTLSGKPLVYTSGIEEAV